MTEETFFIYLSIGLAILLPFGIQKYIARQKYATSVYQRLDVKQRMLGYHKILVPLMRVFLLLSPLYLIFIPWLFSKYTNLSGFIVFVCMVLMVSNAFLEYRFRQWLFQYLENHTQPE